MNSRDQHPIEAIHALVDGRLDGSEREAVDRHIEGCAHCRAERDVAEGTRRVVRRALPDPDLPAGLGERVRGALDDLDRGRSGGEASDSPGADRSGRRIWIWLAPAAAALIVVVALWAWWQRGQPVVPIGEQIVSAVSDDFGAVQKGELALRLPGADAAELQTYLAGPELDLDFQPHVYDLGMMGFEAVGGRVQDLAGRPSALFAYRDANGVLMVCRMYVGDLAELPAPSRTLEHDGITFQVYEREGRTMVFWEEGEVVCVLVSDAPAQAVIDLSFAKAMKV